MFFLALDCDTFTGVRTILLSCLLLALLTDYTPYAEGGISPTAADQPIQEGEAAAEPDSQSIPEDPAITQLEAPEALFELDIGDAEVDFFLEGAWRASLLGSFGVLIGPDGTQLSPFPGFGQGLTFQQMPDLTFSVWLLNRFFIEASVIGDFLEHDYDYFDQNYILMGYLGEEGEFLKRILIGSKDVGIDPFPFVDVPEPGSSSLGVEAVMGTGMSEHQLLLRYDNNEPDSLTYIGSNLVSEQEIALDEYIRGRFFKLPDDDIDAGTLEVYLEDPRGAYSDGDGRHYRKATVDDAELDRENGTVFLKEAASGSLLVYYEIGGSPVGQTVGSQGDGAFPGETGLKLDLSGSNDFDWGQTYLGELMSERQVIVGSDTCLLLYRPGEFSPFEVLSSYALDGTVPEDLSRLRVAIVRKGNLNTKIPPDTADVAFRLTPGEDFIRAYYLDDPDLRAEFRNLYPFLDASNPTPPFDPENLLYGPLADAKPGYLNYEILVSELTPVSTYRIGSDIVPGSVQILRNGISETRFDVDYETGLITFLTEIAEDERLVVSFRRQSALANNGDILFAWGNTLTFSETLNLQLATGVRWNLLPGSYTDEAYTRTGCVVASAGVEGTLGPLSYQASVAGAYTNPDTTGVMRLLGMESTGINVPLSENTAYVASPPNGDDPLTSALDTLTHATRGKLLYKDYRSYGLLGTSVLMPYTEVPPADQIFAYDQNGSKPGPYIAAGSSEGIDSGQSLVLDFDLAADEWVGIQLPVSYGGAVSDLSRMQGISLLYRTLDIDAGSSFTVYLQLGAIGEDLDEDGVLDEELSPSARGFVFDEGNYGVDLRIGSGPKNEGNDRLDSEDVNGNGFLDPDDPSADPDIITLDDLSTITDTVGWTSYTHTFSVAEKRKIARTRSLRLVVVRTGGSDPTGRLLLDEISLAGSRFFADWVVDPVGPAELSAREIEEWEMTDPPSKPLQGTFAEVEDIFHPYEETQKVVEVSWSGGGGQTWQTRGYTEAQTEGIRYRSIVYYTHFPSANGDVLNFSLADEDGNALRWSYPPFATTEWEKIVVSLDQGKIFRNGTELTGAGVDVSEPAHYGSLGLFTVELTNTDAGTLYLDELHLTDPQGSLGAGATLDLELNLPGELVSWGAYPLIHDLSFRQRAAYASRGFSALYGTPLAAQRYSSVSELELGLSLVDMNVDFTVTGTDNLVTLGGGHGLTVPNIPSPVVFTDSFSLRERDTGKELNRKNTLALKIPPVAQLDLQSQAGSLEEILSQSWGADLRITPMPFSLQNSLSISGAVDEFVLGSGGYFSNWIDGYALLFPYQTLSEWNGDKWPSAEELERKADLDLDWSLNTLPAGLQTIWRHGFHSYDFVAAGRMLQSSAEMELSVPLRWQDQGVSLFSITPGYRRHLDVVDPETGVGDYSEDFSRSFETIYGQRYLYGQFPFIELYSPDAEQLFLDLSDKLNKADYSAEAYLRLSRRFSSRIRDLFLPSFFEFSVKKEFVKDEDLTDLYNSYSLSAQSTALNLFGDFGAYPVFSFYRSDEFSTSLSLLMDVAEQTGGPFLRGLEMSLDHFFSFEGEKDEQLTFENRYRLRQDREEIGTEIVWGDTVKLLYLWSRYPENGVRLPFLPEAVGGQGYWSHHESLELELNGPGEDSSYHPFNLILSHKSTALLPDYGEISAEMSAGIDVEKTSGGVRYWRLGFSGGISVQIEF